MRYSGVVEKGNGAGQTLGFPTANIPLENASLSGIYAARVTVSGATYEAAVYADARRKLFEAHLLDFDGDLYGKEIAIELLEKVRDDKEFADEAEARATIANDVQKVRAYLRMR